MYCSDLQYTNRRNLFVNDKYALHFVNIFSISTKGMQTVWLIYSAWSALFRQSFSLQPKKLSLCYKLWFFNLFLNCNPKKSRRSHSIKSVFANFTTYNKVQAYFIFQFNFSNALSWILRGMQGSNCKHISCRVSL